MLVKMEHRHANQQPGAGREKTVTVIVGRCALAEGDYVQVAEQSYVILGMD